jgi:hypothetical protein
MKKNRKTNIKINELKDKTIKKGKDKRVQGKRSKQEIRE